MVNVLSGVETSDYMTNVERLCVWVAPIFCLHLFLSGHFYLSNTHNGYNVSIFYCIPKYLIR